MELSNLPFYTTDALTGIQIISHFFFHIQMRPESYLTTTQLPCIVFQLLSPNPHRRGLQLFSTEFWVCSLFGVAHFDLPFISDEFSSIDPVLCVWLCKLPPPQITFYHLCRNRLRNLAAIKNMLAPTGALSRIARSKVGAFKIITVYITSFGNSIDRLPTFIDSSTFQFNILWIHCLVSDLLMRHIVWQWPHFAWSSLFALARFRITLSAYTSTYRLMSNGCQCKRSRYKCCDTFVNQRVEENCKRLYDRLIRGRKMSPGGSRPRCRRRYNRHSTWKVLIKSLKRALLH